MRLNSLDQCTDLPALRTRFFARVEKRPGKACWPWLGAHTPKGRAQIHVPGVGSANAARVAYLFEKGDIPNDDSHHGITVCHTCDNPSCIRPSHLFLGTQKINLQDAFKKGRMRGGRRPKMTDDQIRAVRGSAKKSREIAEEFGVSIAVVCSIKAYRLYPRIPPSPTDIPVPLRRK